MAFVSVTRLRVRSYRYVLSFLWNSFQAGRQAERSEGFIGGKLLGNSKNVFWTITVWEDGAAMNAYRTSNRHGKAMPKLLHWCDEATVAHWNQESREVPSWQEAHRRMAHEGRPSKVNHPSPLQASNQFPGPEPSRLEQTLSLRARRKMRVAYERHRYNVDPAS